MRRIADSREKTRLEAIVDAATREAHAELVGHSRGLGFCHALWGAQKRILREKYGIDSKSPEKCSRHASIEAAARDA